MPIRRGVTTVGRMAPVTTGNDATHGTRVVALSRLRRRIGENLIRSRRTAAHVWTSVEVDYQALETVRQKHRAEFREREGAALTYLPFVARAAVDALAAFPAVNSSIDTGAGTQTLHGTVNLGIAVDLDQNGLVVVTVRDAGRLALRRWPDGSTRWRRTRTKAAWGRRTWAARPSPSRTPVPSGRTCRLRSSISPTSP